MIIKGRESGSGVIEVIVGSAIILVGVFSILQTYNYYLRFALAHRYDIQASLLAEEGIEAVKLLRDIGWTTKIAALDIGTHYGLNFVDSTWTSVASPEYIDGKFERYFTLADVYRDGSDVIASSGTLDPNTKEVTVAVSYRNLSGTTTKSISTYITNIFGN